MDSGRIVVFDFDGTLTVRDSLPYMLKAVSRPRWPFYVKLLCSAPWLVGYVLHLVPAARAKEQLISRFVKGMSTAEFESRCHEQAQKVRHRLLRPDMVSRLECHVSQGDKVYVCSANIDTWIEQCLEPIKVPIVSTCLEVSDGKLTGRFATPNCNGAEKWKRMRATVETSGLPLTVYGDSKGDDALMSHAQEAFHVDKKGKVSAL